MQERFTAGVATFAAALTILLACIGVYGMLAYSVAARVREIGVRLALGAARGTVVWMIVRDGLAIAVPGVLIGAPCAWAAARLVRAQLYGIAPGDPRTLLIAAAISLATVLAASWLPALRASRVAPVEALGEEWGAVQREGRCASFVELFAPGSTDGTSVPSNRSAWTTRSAPSVTRSVNSASRRSSPPRPC